MKPSCLIERADKTFTIPYQMYYPNQRATLTNLSEHIDESFEYDFEYEINQYGFRYKEPVGTDIFLTVGCSVTFGTGLPYEKTYSQLISKHLGLESVNVSLPGTGPEIQAVNAVWAINKYNPKIVLFYMSDPVRRFLATEDNAFNFVPDYMDNIFPTVNDKKSYIAMEEKFNYTRIMVAAYNLYKVSELCKIKNIPLYFRCWEQFAHSEILKYEFVSDLNVLPDRMGAFDTARDNLHHGVTSQENFAQICIGEIEKKI